MFKYLVVLALALVAVSAAPPAPAPAGVPVRGPAPAPRDLDTANQLLYTYPVAYSSYAYPAYSGYYVYGR